MPSLEDFKPVPSEVTALMGSNACADQRKWVSAKISPHMLAHDSISYANEC